MTTNDNTMHRGFSRRAIRDVLNTLSADQLERLANAVMDYSIALRADRANTVLAERMMLTGKIAAWDALAGMATVAAEIQSERDLDKLVGEARSEALRVTLPRPRAAVTPKPARTRWTKTDVRNLRSHRTEGVDALAILLGRTPSQIRSKASALGISLRKSGESRGRRKVGKR
jgi:hypothetical protein